MPFNIVTYSISCFTRVNCLFGMFGEKYFAEETLWREPLDFEQRHRFDECI